MLDLNVSNILIFIWNRIDVNMNVVTYLWLLKIRSHYRNFKMHTCDYGYYVWIVFRYLLLLECLKHWNIHDAINCFLSLSIHIHNLIDLVYLFTVWHRKKKLFTGFFNDVWCLFILLFSTSSHLVNIYTYTFNKKWWNLISAHKTNEWMHRSNNNNASIHIWHSKNLLFFANMNSKAFVRSWVSNAGTWIKFYKLDCGRKIVIY